MRVALLSDIHANATALMAVLTDVADHRPDLVVCLGDVAAGGPQPREVVARLRDLGCAMVNGNADDVVAGRVPRPSAGTPTPQLKDITEWVREQLSEDELAFLGSFAPVHEVALGGDASLLCYHGSPRSNTDRLLPTTQDGEVAMLVGNPPAAVEAGPVVLAGGHTHTQMLRPHGAALLVNPGTVGSFRHGPSIGPIAEYALVERRGGAVTVKLCRVPYDGHAALAAGMPHAHWWAGLVGATTSQ